MIDSKDYIVYFVATPDNNDAQSACDQEWILNHALQIHDMLLGGLDILGIYGVDLPTAIGKQVFRLKYLLIFSFFTHLPLFKFKTK